MRSRAAQTLFGGAFNRFELHERVLPRLLVDSADRFSGQQFADLPGGAINFAEVADVAARAAGAFQSLGIGRLDTVATLMANRVEVPLTLWGQGWHGGIGVPLNPGHREQTLRHIISDCEASVLVVSDEKLVDVESISRDLPHLKTVVVVGGGDYPTWAGVEFIRWDDLYKSAPLVPAADLAFSDPFIIMYTSGTTGPSKGVVMSHHHHYCYSVPLVDHLSWSPEDHLFTTLPLYHTAAHNTVMLPGLVAGSKVTVRDRFSASGFWSDVAGCGATHALLIGAMGNILMRQPVQPGEAENRLKTLWCVPPPSDIPAFEERFQLEVLWQGWGMTEGYPNQLFPNHPPKDANCIGRSTALFDLDIVDEDDVPVPWDKAAIGEIVFRPNLPSAMMSGYFNNPDATAEAFRNLWFHTGDLASMDADGFLYLWGRKKDAIRRRGENVSAFELEREALGHPAVAQCAAFGVPSDLGEEDIKLDVVLLDGAEITGEALVRYLGERVPGFMIPRYVEFRDALPMTPSERVEKYRLRAEGVSGADYDAGDRTGSVIRSADHAEQPPEGVVE